MSDDNTIFTENLAYSPSALLQLFNNAVNPTPMKKMIQLRGVYVPGRGANYSGVFYDTLKDEFSDAQLTLLVPAALRNRLTAGKILEFMGWLTKRVVPAAGKIEIQASIASITLQTESQISPKEVQGMAILQKKATQGYRDVDSFVKKKIVEQQRISITILVGRSAIIDSDIKHALEEAIAFYDLRFERLSLTSEKEILEALERYNDAGLNDIVVLSRGGGENMAIFDSPEIADACVGMEPLFISAIGHKEDVNLVQKVADKPFITPTALGQWLKVIYNDTIVELESSKARLVETVKEQLKAGYEKQAENMIQKMKDVEELNRKARDLHERELKSLQEQLGWFQSQKGDRDQLLYQISRMEERRRAAQRRNLVICVVLAVLALLAGWILGRR